jgi:superfamily I DNA/RNA helicase
VHRIEHLLDNGEAAASILALTFSNKAAEEMRERLSAMDPKAAIEMWAGTFHAFGWELLSKHSDRIGRTFNVRVLDETGCLGLLENNLSRLPLRNYLNIYEPAFELTHLLKAISRCKDEMITPEVYLAEAEAASKSADPAVREAADKALEVAAVYKVYQELLLENDAVDFGDLVMLAADLLIANPDLAAMYQANFKHIVVDEYQDVNFASARLLRALCAPDTNVWVVADPRQSIYRFRGAEPGNVERFEQEFGGARRSLKHNYRSGQPVVQAFAAFANAMEGVSIGGAWTANRGHVGGVSMVVAPDAAAEAAAIRTNIETLRSQGVSYGDQVILARSHLTLARICGHLERLGVPLLYLGDLFERPEIRDLLSLVALDAEFGSVGLVRVAQFPEYGASKEDALAVLRWMRSNETNVFDALRRLDAIQGISENGRAGLAILASHLQGMGPSTTPWAMLTTYLVERSRYLSELLAANDSKSQQKLVAIYQFLKVCSEHAANGDASRKRLLERIRRIEALNDDRIFRPVASEASDMDAVRVMTVHGSKGLEFKGVHLPGLATRYMPSTRQWARCPPPPGLARLGIQPEDHDAEEECLFFVALSRARDHLCLSRAERYTTQNASPSKFLNRISALPARRAAGVTIESPAPRLLPPPARDVYEERELSLYIKCPARYHYEVVSELRGSGDSSAYVRFHGCVYRTVGWLEEQRGIGQPVDQTAALTRLDADWSTRGPIGHGFEQFYRTAASAMVVAMAVVVSAESGTYSREAWQVRVGRKSVSVTPDRVIIGADGVVRVQRIRTGRQTASEPDNRIYALLRHGAMTQFPSKRISIETYYPATAEAIVVPVGRKEQDKLNEYAEAIAAIERGEFPIKTSDRQCPSCAFYFICGS